MKNDTPNKETCLYMNKNDKKQKKLELQQQLQEKVDLIRDHLKKSKKEEDIKTLKSEFLNEEEQKTLKNRISDALKSDNSISFQYRNKVYYFKYDDQEKQNKQRNIDKFKDVVLKSVNEQQKPRIDHIEADTFRYVGRALDAKDKWYLKVAIKQLKRQKVINLERDGKTTVIQPYLAKEGNDVKEKIKAQLQGKILRVQDLKKQFSSEFLNNNTKTFSKILRLILDENEDKFHKERIGTIEYIYCGSQSDEFRQRREQFEQDVQKFKKAIHDSNDQQVQVNDLGENFNYQEVVKYLNQEKGSKVYEVLSEEKDKGKVVKYSEGKMNEQKEKLVQFFENCSQLGDAKDCGRFLYDHLQKIKKVQNWLKMVQDINFQDRPKKTSTKKKDK